MRTTDTSYTLYRETEDGQIEHELIIMYEYSPYIPAQTYGPPESCSPAEGGEVYIIQAFDEEGAAFELTPDEEAKITFYIQERLPEDDDDDRDYPDYDD